MPWSVHFALTRVGGRTNLKKIRRGSSDPQTFSVDRCAVSVHGQANDRDHGRHRCALSPLRAAHVHSWRRPREITVVGLFILMIILVVAVV